MAATGSTERPPSWVGRCLLSSWKQERGSCWSLRTNLGPVNYSSFSAWPQRQWLFLPPGLGRRGGCRGSKHTVSMLSLSLRRGASLCGAESPQRKKRPGRQIIKFPKKDIFGSVGSYAPPTCGALQVSPSPRSQPGSKPEQILCPILSTSAASVSAPLTS